MILDFYIKELDSMKRDISEINQDIINKVDKTIINMIEEDIEKRELEALNSLLVTLKEEASNNKIAINVNMKTGGFIDLSDEDRAKLDEELAALKLKESEYIQTYIYLKHRINTLTK